MKIARYSHAGTIAFGIVDDDELVVLTGDPMFAGYNPTGQRLPLVDVALLAPVIPRSKIVGLAGAYFSDAAEKAAALAAPGGPAEPRFFLKPNTSVVGPNDPIVLPTQSDDVRVEGELAIVIGRITKNVSVADASTFCSKTARPPRPRASTRSARSARSSTPSSTRTPPTSWVG
jgi:2-keto-4-pentenoate hydratase/2-oxohepta-3-ene-1,7-dioic acid hydratase in catechol pathway